MKVTGVYHVNFDERVSIHILFYREKTVFLVPKEILEQLEKEDQEEKKATLEHLDQL